MSNAQSFVGDCLIYLLAAVSEPASAQFHAHARAAGLRVPEWRILAFLTDDDGAIITRLVALSLLEQSRLTRIVDEVAERRLVTRRADLQDARRVHEFLTEDVRSPATRPVSDACQDEAMSLEQLTPVEAATIMPLLKALLAQFSG